MTQFYCSRMVCMSSGPQDNSKSYRYIFSKFSKVVGLLTKKRDLDYGPGICFWLLRCWHCECTPHFHSEMKCCGNPTIMGHDALQWGIATTTGNSSMDNCSHEQASSALMLVCSVWMLSYCYVVTCMYCRVHWSSSVQMRSFTISPRTLEYHTVSMVMEEWYSGSSALCYYLLYVYQKLLIVCLQWYW